MQLIYQNQQKIIKRIEHLKKPSKKKTFKLKIEEIKEILYDPIIDRDEKIEEIKKNI